MPDSQAVAGVQCEDCGAQELQGLRCCRRCGGTRIVTRTLTGRGTLVSWTVVRRPSGPFAGRDVFAVALVDLDDGPRVTGNLAEFAHEPALGVAVQAVGELDGVPIFAEVKR